MQAKSDFGDQSTVDGSFIQDIDMNGIPSLSNGVGGFDSCGLEEGIQLSVDSRNLKWQARNNGMSQAAASKSFNHKNMLKYMQRRNDKMEREQHKLQSENVMKQIQQENKKWAPVDQEDARHLQREAAKRAKDQAKQAKVAEKQKIQQEDEENNSKSGKSSKSKHWGKQ
eukprot:403350504